jgi:hypothetical protein
MTSGAAGAVVTAAGAVTVVRTVLKPPPQAAVNTTPIRAAPGSQAFLIMFVLSFVPDATDRTPETTKLSRDAWAGKPKAR